MWNTNMLFLVKIGYLSKTLLQVLLIVLAIVIILACSIIVNSKVWKINII